MKSEIFGKSLQCLRALTLGRLGAEEIQRELNRRGLTEIKPCSKNLRKGIRGAVHLVFNNQTTLELVDMSAGCVRLYTAKMKLEDGTIAESSVPLDTHVQNMVLRLLDQRRELEPEPVTA